MNSGNETSPSPSNRVTVRDIAKVTGIHFTTVAKALRGSPGVKEATRKLVCEKAEEMGYQPNPLVSALSQYRSKNKTYRGTLYWINAFEEKNRFLDDDHYYGDCYRGAKERCDQLGYRLEIFWIPRNMMGCKHGSSILQNRNASGIILGPTPFGLDEFELDWANFTTVRIGYSYNQNQFSTVTTDHFGNIALLYKRLVENGFQRIGFCCTRNFDQRSFNHWSGSYLAMRRAIHPEVSIAPFLDPHPKGSPTDFLRWFNAERPQVIIAGDGFMYLDILRSSGVRVPQDVQLVSLHADFSKNRLAGIMQNGVKVGRVAVEHLTAILQRFERGLESDPRTILLMGEWSTGETFEKSLCPAQIRSS